MIESPMSSAEKLSSAEKRKNLRRSIAYPAFIVLADGSPPRECTFCDASQEGAQLAVVEPDSVPDEFILALSADGAARRRCRVAWRAENQIGVEFLKDLKKNALPVQKPVMRSSAPKSADAGASAEPAERLDIDTLTPR
jgi:hypothetical protein